jgi:hypothetical protein
MAFLQPIASAVGGMFSSAAPAAAGAAGAGAGAGLSGAAGASLTGAGMASSMGYGAPIAAGAAASAAPAAAGSSGFMSGMFAPFMTDGKYDSTKAGGIVGSMLGQGLMQGGQGASQPANIKLGDISTQVQQALQEKPWATPRFDSSSYINDLMRGG